MAVQYHKHLDRILVRRAAETQSLEKQVDANRPAPKIALGLFCLGLAGMAFVFVPSLFPLWLVPGIGGVVSFYGAFSVWRQVKQAEAALSVEQTEEEYRRFLLAKLGAQRFDSLVVAVGAGGSDASIIGWLKPLGFDEHDIDYLLWLAEALLESMGGAPKSQRKPAAPAEHAASGEALAKSEAPAGGTTLETSEITPPVIPVAELAERAASEPAIKSLESEKKSEREASASGTSQAPPAGPASPDLKRLSDDEVAKFKQLAAQRKQEYQKWLDAGGRDTDPDDPFGKLKDFSPEKIAGLRRKAQERRKQGAAPASSAPAPGAADHPGAFDEHEMTELARKALSRFEPKPVSGQGKAAPGETLGEVFGEDELAALKEKAERKAEERKSGPARDDDPDWDESKPTA